MTAPHELSRLDPTGRFSGLAHAYAKFRPSYPAHAIDFIMARCAFGKESLLVDVGCGTGIASRLFALRGLNVIGIEPNTEMRCAAASVETVDPDPGKPQVDYREGRAEATGLPSGIANAVVSAQAFHWFEPVATLAEFHRILKPSGWTVLMWNERDERDPITAAYGDVIRSAMNVGLIEDHRQARAAGALRTSRLFRQTEQVTFHNYQSLDEERLIGRAFSNSYAPREQGERQAWADQLKTIFHQYQRDDKIVLNYETRIYLAQRA